MPTQLVTYAVDANTTVRFEIEPIPGFAEASVDEVVGRIKDAVGPAMQAARVVLDQVRRCAPDQVEVKFGVKVSGTVNWLVARAASEGNFEVTMRWRPGPDGPTPH